MGSHRPFWESVHRVFDPRQPVRDPALFVERDPKHNPADRMRRDLARPYGARRFLLLGTVGNGKSSELFHQAHLLARDRMVVLLDVWEHFERVVGDPGALDRLQPWEMVGLVGLAVYRAAEERFGHPWGEEPRRLQAALARLRGEAAHDVDVARLARAVGVFAGGALGLPVVGGAMQLLAGAAEATEWDWRIGLPGERRRADQDGEVQAVLDAVRGMVGALHEAYGRRLVLIVDGLDRVREDAAIRGLFVDSSLLADLGCDAVFTAPLPLLQRHAQGVRGFETVELANVPVLDHADPGRPGAGVGFFRDLVARRLDVLRRKARSDGFTAPADPFPAEIVERLAWTSGGVVRDFVKLVQTAADAAWDADAPALDDDAAKYAVEEARRMKEMRLTTEEIALLERVAADPDHRLPGDDLAARLLGELRLLPYPNRCTWYYPHPLLTLELVKTPRS